MHEICSISFSECAQGQSQTRTSYISSSADNRKWEKGPQEGSKRLAGVARRSDSLVWVVKKRTSKGTALDFKTRETPVADPGSGWGGGENFPRDFADEAK